MDHITERKENCLVIIHLVHTENCQKNNISPDTKLYVCVSEGEKFFRTYQMNDPLQ